MPILKSRLPSYILPPPSIVKNSSVTPVYPSKQPSFDQATDKKIPLFKSFVKGRTDVFPQNILLTTVIPSDYSKKNGLKARFKTTNTLHYSYYCNL